MLIDVVATAFDTDGVLMILMLSAWPKAGEMGWLSG